jgi:hypothetical protein
LSKLADITKIGKATLTMELDKQTGENIDYLATAKEPQRPNVNSSQIILMNWQTLIAVEGNKADSKINQNIFELIKNLSPELSKFKSVQDYLVLNKTQLEMIGEKVQMEKLEPVSILQVLMSIIDQNISQLVGEDRLAKIYLELKQK